MLMTGVGWWHAWHSLEWEAKGRAWPVLLCPHGDERSLIRKAKPPGSQAALPGCTDSPLSCSPCLAALPHTPQWGQVGAESLPGCTDSTLIFSLRHTALLYPWPHPSSPPPSRWGQVGAESLPGLCPTQCTQLQSLSELVAPSQTHGNQLPWKLGTLSPIQGASLSHLPETGASSVVPSCSDARLRTRLRTVSR